LYRRWRNKQVAEGLEAYLRERAEQNKKTTAQRTRPEAQAAPMVAFDPWSTQRLPDVRMGSLLGLDPEKARRDRLIRALMGVAR
jgi:hypothetical protein